MHQIYCAEYFGTSYPVYTSLPKNCISFSGKSGSVCVEYARQGINYMGREKMIYISEKLIFWLTLNDYVLSCIYISLNWQNSTIVIK